MAPNRERRRLLLGSDDHGGYFASVDCGVEKLRAGQLREVDQFVADLLNFARDLVAGFHPKLDSLSDIFLDNPEDGIAGLQIDFALRESSGASKSKEQSNKK